MVAKSEEEVLDQLLEEQNSIWPRILGRLWSAFTLLVVVALMLVTMRQVAQTEQDAFDAHRREVRVQQALNSARLVQAISAEQFLSFGAASSFRDPCGRRDDPLTPDCEKQVKSAVSDVIHGSFVDMRALRGLRTFSSHPEADPADQALATAARHLNAIERWVAPLASTADELTHHELAQAMRASAAKGRAEGSSVAWDLLEARLDGLTVQVGGSDARSCKACANLLWETDPETGSRRRRLVSPEDSLEVRVWQAECLRKLPTLISYELVDRCGKAPGPDSDDRTKAAWALAREDGKLEAERYFAEATDWIESNVSLTTREGEECQALLDEEGTGVGVRTLATTAARAYNGHSMTLINRKSVTNGQLAEATTAIKQAICLREQAQQTKAEVALSRENLAVIAYRTAYEAYDRQQVDEAALELEKARCYAELAVDDNHALAWSYTVLYLTQPVGRVDCAKRLGQPGIQAGARTRSSGGIYRKLTFFEPEEFNPDELPGLLPLFPAESDFNRTGHESLGPLLRELAAEHAALRQGSEAGWLGLAGLAGLAGELGSYAPGR